MRENGVLEDGILQAIMRNANVNLGTSPYNSEFVSGSGTSGRPTRSSRL